MSHDLVASVEIDHGCGAPYDPCYRTHGLYRNSERVYGKRYFLAIQPDVSKSWISDEDAAEWVATMKAEIGKPRHDAYPHRNFRQFVNVPQ